jgi:hypothetical protein
MNLNYYITLGSILLEASYQRAKQISSPSMKKCAKLANAEKDPRKRQGVYNKCMKASGDSDDPTDTAGEILRGGSPFK